MASVVVRAVLGVVIVYLMFWVLWLARYSKALLYLLRSKDKKWPATADPEARARGVVGRRDAKRVVFVRHGQSTWNITFNESKLPHLFAARLFKSAFEEVRLWAQNVRDSWFYDSPLSVLGIAQAEELRATVFDTPNPSDTVRRMRGEIGKTMIVSSNLRRAITTAIVGLYNRLQRTEEKIVVLPCLQEVSTNPDTLSITPPYQQPVPSWIENSYSGHDIPHMLAKQVDVSQNTGDKAVTSNGLERMEKFCEWLFESDLDMAIVAGHSLWFRGFFREFLPHSTNHEAKNTKIANGGAIAFTLEQYRDDKGTRVFRIDPSSIEVVHGGFKKD